VIVYRPYYDNRWYVPQAEDRFEATPGYRQPEAPLRALPPEYPDDGWLHPTYRSGRDWGQELRRQAVTWEALATFYRHTMARAEPGLREMFRRGFTDGYGENAEAVWLKLQPAASPVPPPAKIFTPYGTVESHASE
jgi:hypothetical protein